MKKEYKTIICIIAGVFLAMPTTLAMNVPVVKTANNIKAEVELQLGMKLLLCEQIDITNGYDLLFISNTDKEDMREIRYFEAYYNGFQTIVTERFLTNPVYEVEPAKIIQLNPLVTGQAISLSGSIMMTSSAPPFVIIRSHTTNAGFAKVTARGFFLASLGKIRMILDLSSETHDLDRVPNFRHWSSFAPDRSWGKVEATCSYYSIINPDVWNVWAWVIQYSDRISHWAHNGGKNPGVMAGSPPSTNVGSLTIIPPPDLDSQAIAIS